jgi:quercetin dioxygenase-like cupin family protein
MPTGHHAAVSAGVKKGDVVAVVGDGAVGLCAVLAARRLGAQRIVALSRHPERQRIAREFGATDIVEARGEEATLAVLDLTAGIGADAALECVGTAPDLAHTGGSRMEISHDVATAKGPGETFTGQVWIDSITRDLPSSQLNVAAVHFTPAARTAWHSHEGGQTLYVTEGRGLVQARGQDIVELHAGDVVFAPDGEEHWHGARPDHFMTHLSITEGPPRWRAQVTDAEYRGQGDLPE